MASREVFHLENKVLIQLLHLEGMTMSDSYLKLSERDSRVLRGVCDLPLVSAGELANFFGVAFSTVSRRLGWLEEMGLVDSALMGAAFTAARRYRLTPGGARRFLEPEVYFHQTRRINQIACLLPAVEWFYRLAIKLPEMAYTGHFRSFHWRLKDGVDAVAHYDGGTVAFLWSGPWQTEASLVTRLETLGEPVFMTGGWPSLVCVVAADFWQACRANDTLSSFGLKEGTLVFCAETKKVSSNVVPKEGRPLLTLTPLLGSLVDPVSAELPRMMLGVRAGKDASLVHRILYLIEQFPGAKVPSISRSVGSHSRYVLPKVQRLIEEGLLVQVDGYHYLSGDALGVSARRDRVHYSRPRRRFGLRDDGLPAVARYRQHDAAAFSIVSVFREGGFPVAGGWRGDDYSGGRDAIAPDALVYMGEGSSGGAGWYYFEYERRADSARGVANKMRGYVSRGSKRTPFPLLVVARSDSVAAEFRRQAAEAGHPLWAISIPSIRVDDPKTIIGADTAWLDAWGKPATFLPP